MNEARSRRSFLKLLPLGVLAGVFASIGLPGFANFSAEVMVFFGAFRVGAEMGRFHIFQIATVLALWGVVISAVYMLRAYRATFMGRIREQSIGLRDLSGRLRAPVVLLVAALFWVGFFPQSLVQILAPTFQTYLSAPTSHHVGSGDPAYIVKSHPAGWGDSAYIVSR